MESSAAASLMLGSYTSAAAWIVAVLLGVMAISFAVFLIGVSVRVFLK